jgi:hypothetical protein
MSLKLVKSHLRTLQEPKNITRTKKRKHINPNSITTTTQQHNNKRRNVNPKAARKEGKRIQKEVIREIEREKEDKKRNSRKNVKTLRALASRKGDIAAETLEKLLQRKRR